MEENQDRSNNRTARQIAGWTVSDIDSKFAGPVDTTAFRIALNSRPDEDAKKRKERSAQKEKNTLQKYYDEDEIGRANKALNRYKGESPTRLFARALTTNGGSRGYIDPETGKFIDTAFKVTDYEVSSNPRFRNSTIVTNVGSPNASVLDPNTGSVSSAVYGQVDVATKYGIRAEFRTIRLDKVDHAGLYRAYLNQR